MFLTEMFDDRLTESHTRQILENADTELQSLISAYISDPLSDATESIIKQAAYKLKQWAVVKQKSGYQNPELLNKIMRNPEAVTRQLLSNVFVKQVSCQETPVLSLYTGI